LPVPVTDTSSSFLHALSARCIEPARPHQHAESRAASRDHKKYSRTSQLILQLEANWHFDRMRDCSIAARAGTNGQPCTAFIGRVVELWTRQKFGR